MEKAGLPVLNYRTSATFGPVRTARISTSSVHDIFRATVNRCATINSTGPPNGLVIGEEFYKTVKSFKDIIRCK